MLWGFATNSFFHEADGSGLELRTAELVLGGFGPSNP